MKIKLISLVVSLVFIPVAVLAQYIGLYLGKILYFIYEKIMFLNMPDFLIIIAPLVISGFLAGYLAAKAVQLIYKKYHLIFCLIIPVLLILASVTGNLLNPANSITSLELIGMILREVVTIVIFYVTLKSENSNLQTN